MKIAVASSDGKVVDTHFGKAQHFFIFEFDEERTKFLEYRESSIDPIQKYQWHKSLGIIKDCDVVICSEIGMKAKIGLESIGIKVVKDEGSIKEVLDRFIAHYKFMKKPLF